MNNYFEEKSIQVEPTVMSAFGISIYSRYGKARELIEMLNFCQALANDGLHGYVKSLFYDSKANICSFEFNEDVENSEKKAQKIKKFALEHIGQFELFGYIDHGKPFTDVTLDSKIMHPHNHVILFSGSEGNA